jgi:tetratricopeptide (TPR) repeat protein
MPIWVKVLQLKRACGWLFCCSLGASLGCATISPRADAHLGQGSNAENPVAQFKKPLASQEFTRIDAAKLDPLWDLALLVSGYEDSDIRQSVLHKLKDRVGPILVDAAGQKTVAEKATALLQGLHRPFGLLKKYNARATTLKEIVETGEYNCLSASVLFALLADRIGLNVLGELLPSHARILIKDASRSYRVETTSSLGFDPSEQVLKRILDQSLGIENFRSRSLVGARGAETKPQLLIALMYVNRASIAQERGQLRLAEQLFRRGEGLASDANMKMILREQRAALLSQLGANDMISGVPQRELRAFQTMLRSARLDPKEPMIREAVHQNLRASAERVISKWAIEDKDESAILSLFEQAMKAGLPRMDAAGLNAFAYSEIARMRARKLDYDGALQAMDRAMAQSLSPKDRKLKHSLVQNQVAALRLAAMTSAKSGAYAKSMQMIERLLKLDGLSMKQRREYESDRKRALLFLAEKEMSDKDFSAAAVIYRAGRRLYPEDQTFKHNLIAALERESLRMIDEGRCERLAELLREIRSLDKNDVFSQPAQIRCLLIRAKRRLQNDDYAEAIAWLDAARNSYPKSDLLRENLVLAYLKWIQFEARQRHCIKARRLHQKLRSIAEHGVKRRQGQAVLGDCVLSSSP